VAPQRSLERLVGERLRNLRLRGGFTQRELAQRVPGGMDLSYIGRIERGEQLPSLKALHKLGQALDVPIGEFFGREPIDRTSGAGRVPATLWRALTQVSPQDAPILLAVARLLARRRGAAVRYRGRLPALSAAAERRRRYRKG
jgi:transcriptional regulator with XRE-family HTH domain